MSISLFCNIALTVSLEAALSAARMIDGNSNEDYSLHIYHYMLKSDCLLRA